MHKAEPHADVRFVRELDGTYFVTREVAEAVGVPAMRLRRIIAANPQLRPGHEGHYGVKWMDLWSEADVARLVDWLAEHPREPGGRVRLWSVEEYADRQRRDARARYWRRRAEQLDQREARAALRRADQLEKELREQAYRRRAERATGRCAARSGSAAATPR